MDRVAFTLDRPQSGKAGLVRVLASPKDSSNKSTPLQPAENNGKMSRAQTRSSINAAEGEKGALSRSSSAAAGGESPTMADMSSDNGEESPQSPQKQTRAKKGGGKRKSRRNLLTPPNQGYSSGAEQSQSAFPIPTPDR